MASSDEKESDLLTCPVCRKKYTTPKLISCGHSVCMEPCLQNLLQGSCPRCPVCDSEIQTSSSSTADSFPTNLALDALTNRSERDLETPLCLGNIKRSVQRKMCELHEEVLDKFCETCLELICGKCTAEFHGQLHEVSSITETAKKYFEELEGIGQQLKTANERLEKVSEMLEGAKLKCETDADSIKTEISEAESWAVQLVKNCVLDLSSKINKRKGTITKEIKTFESQRLDISLFSSYLTNVYESLKKEHAFTVTSKGVVDNLKRKTEKLLEDISTLEDADIPDGIGLSFRAASSNNLEGNCLGRLETKTFQAESSRTACKMWKCERTQDLHKVELSGTYCGFAWVKESSTYCRTFIWSIYGTGRDGCLSINIDDDMSIISPITDISGLSVLGHSYTSVYKITVDPSRHQTKYVERALDSNDSIVAVCWDENRTDCYALLDDGMKIVRVNFSGLVGRKFQITLDEPLVSEVTSRKFHVSELGGMAICETDRKMVLYYSSVKAKATKIVTAPPDINGWYPVFVITRKFDQRWFVVWETLSYEIEKDGVPYARIYQYSKSFDLEGLSFKLGCYTIEAFSFNESDYNDVPFLNNTGRRRLQVAIEKILYHSQERVVSVCKIDIEKDDSSDV